MYDSEIRRASLKHLRKAVKNKSRYVPLDDGTLGIIPEEWMEKFARYFAAGQLSNEELLIPKTGFTRIEELYEADMLDDAVHTEIEHYREKLTH